MNRKVWLFLAVLIVLIIAYKQFQSADKSSPVQQTAAKSEVNESITNVKSEAVSETKSQAAEVKKESSKTLKAAPKTEVSWNKEDLAEIEKRRSSAKFALASGFTAMAAFHAEFNRYTTDLRSLGFMPMQNEIGYKMGFLAQYRPPIDETQNTREDWDSDKNLTTDTYIGEFTDRPDQKFSYVPELRNVSLQAFSKYCERGCTATDQEFEIMILVPLPKSDRFDVWVVNEKKEIIQVLDGTK